MLVLSWPSFWSASQPFSGFEMMVQIFYFEKIRVFKAGVNAVNTLAWNNKIGLRFYFVGFWTEVMIDRNS